MKWIETIMIRSSEEIPGDLIQGWTRSFKPEGKKDYQVEVKIYRNYPLKTDLNIQIQWESDIDQVGESSLGKRLHHIMKDYGLICHTVWIEEAFDQE